MWSDENFKSSKELFQTIVVSLIALTMGTPKRKLETDSDIEDSRSKRKDTVKNSLTKPPKATTAAQTVTSKLKP